MPDVQGKYNLGDFVSDLQQRGFDGFQVEELRRLVNRAYFAVAKKSRWEWERSTVTFTISPGQPTIDVNCTPTSQLPYFRSLERLYKVKSDTTAGMKMEIMSEGDFYQNYLGQDWTQTNLWNEPTKYFIYNDLLWLLSPPTAQRSFVAYYFRRPVAMQFDVDVPITPQHLDEAIIDAARVRAHTRANEPGLAMSAFTDLQDAFDDMKDDEEEDMHELQERVTPDRTWA
jgi:hypothetical protein